MYQTDIEIYEDSLNLLVENLNKNVESLDSDYVVALSRKGPRLLEYLKKAKGLKPINVITEHALPFLFEHICQNKDENVRLHIVDDAIYFGSTIASLKEEVETYIKFFELEDRVSIEGIYACIKDLGSLDFGNTKMFTLDNIRPGYGHYFVKQVMSNLRSLGKSLEVEYPTIKYRFEKPIDIDELYSLLKESFGEDKVYHVSESIGINSVSVLVSEVNEPSFRKLRMFVDGKELSIVSMAPELTLINLRLFKFVGFGNLLEVNSVWRSIAKRLIGIADTFDENKTDKRNIVRTGVVLLNYFSSLDTYCYYRLQIENVLQKALGDIVSKKIDTSNLLYLVGNERDVNEITHTWENAMENPQYSTIPYNALDSEVVDDVVFESSLMYGSVGASLKNSNLAQLQNVKSMDEALSAMFFNQTLLIERWSRFSGISKQERLRFGYTFQYLWSFIHRNASNLNADDLQVTAMHRWIDTQIDNGCIVPQYVLDKNIFQWIRVFRPGENEDIQLSHMGRLVAHVIQRMNRSEEDQRVGKVIKHNLEGVLTAIYNKFGKEFRSEELGWHLHINAKKHVLYVNENNDTLVDYLIRMGILDIDGKLVSISTKVGGQEYSKYTTLSSQLQNSIDVFIEEILDEMGNKPQASTNYPSTINYFLLDTVSVEAIMAALGGMKNILDEMLRKIIATKPDELNENELEKQVFDYFAAEVSCYSIKESVLLNRHTEKLDILRPYLWKVRKVVHAINVFTLVTFYQDTDSLRHYLETIDSSVKEKLEYSDLIDYLDTQKEKKTPLISDKPFLYKLIRYITNI